MRQGTPGANTATDHLTVLDLAPTSPNHPFQVGQQSGSAVSDSRHAHAVEMSREGVPLLVNQPARARQRSITSVYLRGVDNTEIIHTVHQRPAPVIPANNGLRTSA